MKLSLVLRNKKNALKLSAKTLESFIERIKTDTKDGAVSRRRRNISVYGEDTSYDQQFPSHLIYPSVEWTKDANDNLQMLRFNGLVALTVVNLLRPEDLQTVKQAAQILHYTQAAFIGPSGREVIILVKIDGGNPQPTGEEADAICKKGHDLAVSLYKGILPSVIRDEEASTRSCFRMPLDPEPYYNPKAMALKVPQSPLPQSHDEKTTEQLPVSDNHLYTQYEQMYRRAADDAFKEIKTIEGDAQQQAYMTALAHKLCEMGVPEEEAALHIRNHHQFKPGFDLQEMRTIVDTVYAETGAKKKPFDSSLETGTETRRLVDFLTTRFQFRFNTMMGYTEYRPNNTYYVEWQPVDDRALKGITMEVRLGGINARDNDVRRYVQSSMILQYNPIGEYLWEQYGKWDGKDHIRQLARTVPTNNPHWEDWFYTWFLGMVHQWQVSHLAKYGNQTVPLLISAQGWNKSTFCESLLPPELSWGYTANIDISEKRPALQAMAQMLLINLDEFNQISPKTQQGFLKNIITLSSVKIKRPYGRHVEDFPRRASFIATTNQADVLADPSGNRRFLGVELTGPIDVSTPPNHGQLYAQAMQALHNHVPYYFGPEETRLIMEENRKFSLKTAAEQFFLDYFEPVRNEQDGEWMSASAILAFLKDEVGVSLLKSPSVPAFGRKLSVIPGIIKRDTSSNTLYLVLKIR